MRAGPFAAGEPALLIDRKSRFYLVWLKPGAFYDLHSGRIPYDDLIGQPEGISVRTTRGDRLLAVRPTLADYVLGMPRGAQVIYPKDLALILMLADIYPGATVAEAGTGSGALTMALIRAVGVEGRVFSYDVRQEFLDIAARNISRYLGETPTLVLRRHDVSTGIPDAPVDRIVLDLPEPWRVVGPAIAALRPGGVLLAFLPTTVQVQQAVETLRASGAFGLISTVEAMVRPWNIEGLSVRPAHRMVAHTGFLVTARRLAAPGTAASMEPAPDAAFVDRPDDGGYSQTGL
jgi:tRNA (adenine57-N1/adenine58-N1)-methyltransferase